jgi:hypothetical protein
LAVFLEIQIELSVIGWMEPYGRPNSVEPIHFTDVRLKTAGLAKLDKIAPIFAVIVFDAWSLTRSTL